MANELLLGSGPKDKLEKKKVGRPPKKKVSKFKVDTIPVEDPKDVKLMTGLVNVAAPTWAYKKGCNPVLLKTDEEVLEYASNGWSDSPQD